LYNNEKVEYFVFFTHFSTYGARYNRIIRFNKKSFYELNIHRLILKIKKEESGDNFFNRSFLSPIREINYLSYKRFIKTETVTLGIA